MSARTNAEIQARIKEIKAKAGQIRLATPLPSWGDDRRAFPNLFIRSALFGALQKGDRKNVRRRKIGAAVGNYTFYYTGVRLDQLDFDIVAQLFHYARQRSIATEVEFVPNRLLADIGHQRGGTQFKLLERRLDDLHACNLTIKNVSGTAFFAGAILRKGIVSADCGAVVLNEYIRELFEPDSYTELHWADRLSLKQNQYAKWLHAFYCSHAKPYKYKLDTLRALMGVSDRGHIRHFAHRLEGALKVLEARKLIASFEIDGQAVLVRRVPTPSQQRHLDRQMHLTEALR